MTPEDREAIEKELARVIVLGAQLNHAANLCLAEAGKAIERVAAIIEKEKGGAS